MIIKNVSKIAIILITLLSLSACSESNSKNKLTADAKTSIDKVIDEQIKKFENNLDTSKTDDSNEKTETKDSEKKSETDDSDKKSPANTTNSTEEKTNINTNVNEENLDYDLTTMSNEMVYATVYDFVSYPENYIGKKIKIAGLYYVATNEEVQKNYHYVMITDATTCCSQGIEFVWEDGSHVYPDEYPEEGTVIVVVGIFESYIDEDDGMSYCRLKDSSMKIIN